MMTLRRTAVVIYAMQAIVKEKFDKKKLFGLQRDLNPGPCDTGSAL